MAGRTASSSRCGSGHQAAGRGREPRRCRAAHHGAATSGHQAGLLRRGRSTPPEEARRLWRSGGPGGAASPMSRVLDDMHAPTSDYARYFTASADDESKVNRYLRCSGGGLDDHRREGHHRRTPLMRAIILGHGGCARKTRQYCVRAYGEITWVVFSPARPREESRS